MRHERQDSKEYPHSYSDSEYGTGRERRMEGKRSKRREKDKKGGDRQRDRTSHMAASLF